MKKKKLVVLALLCLGIFSLFANNNAFALDENDLLKKVLWRGLSKCYTSKYMLNEVDGTNGGVSLNDIFKDKGKKVDDEAILVFSNGIGNSLTQAVPDVSCKQVFEGYNEGSGSNSIKGLLQLTGKPFDISQLGFIREGDIPYDVTCFKVKFSVTASGVSSSTGESNSLCISTEKDTITEKEKLLREGGSWRYNNVVEGDEKLVNGVKLKLTLDGSGQLAFIASDGKNTTPLYSLNECATLGVGDSTMDDVGNFKQCIEDSLFYTDPNDPNNSHSMLILNRNTDAEQPLFGFEVVQTPVGGPSNGEDNVWKKKNFGAALDALHYFDGPEDMAGVVFTDQEKYDVLLKYVNDTVKNNKNKVGVNLDACYDTAGELGDQYGIPIQNGKWCVINGVDNVNNLQFNVIEAYQNQALRTVNFEGVLKRLKELAPNVDTSGSGVHVGIEEDEATEETCRNSEGSETLGWILCPMMSMMGKAAEGMYTNMVEQHLMIEPSLFRGEDESSDTRNAWAIFRDIANVLFIILFLVVIFSQLTGIGIDNYGIKKILPRLIVAAVLINLSYLICLLMVDLSNILGSGLRSIFDSLGSSLNPEIVLPDDLHFANSASSSVSIGGVLAGVGIAGALVAVVGVSIWRNPSIILTLLLGLLGVVIAIFFLFFLLGARKAAVIILTVISPLAVVAYMLPNTKKLADRWLKMFEGLLMVYPIIGLLVGAGDYASKLLLKTSGGFLMWITAMVVGVAPIFFIPTVLKGAFSAMGKVGGMLTGLGAAARGKATGALRNSEGFKNAQRMGLERRTRLRAGYDEKTGGLTRIGRARAALAQTGFGRVTGMNKRQAARLAQAKKNDAIGQEATATLVAETSAANIARSGLSKEAFFEKQFNDAARNGDVRKMNSAIDAAKQRGVKTKDIAKMIRDTANSGNMNFKDNQSKANWMNSLNTKYGDIMSTDFELSMWAMKGGNETLGDYGQYASAGGVGMDDIKPEDVAKLSGDSLAGMIASGKINQSMAQRVMAMNPNISADKKIMLGAAATGATITDANAFKNEAKALASNSGATTWEEGEGATKTTHAITQITAKGDTISAWAAATPQDVNVVQNFTAGGRQYDAVKGDLVGDSATMLGNIETSTGHTAAATTQTAVNTHQTATNTERGATAAEQTVLNTRQTAINTHQTATNTERGATAAEGVMEGLGTANTELETIRNNTTPRRVERGVYNNISGKSSMRLTRMSDGTLRDDSGNVYDQGRWKKA